MALHDAMTVLLAGQCRFIHATALGPSDLPEKKAKRFQAKMICVAQKRTKSLTFKHRFTSFTRKHSFDFLTIILPQLPSVLLA